MTTGDDELVEPGQRTMVYQYGARRAPTDDKSERQVGRRKTAYPDLSEGAMEQLWMAHQMRNQLVELEHKNEEAIAAIWATVPQLAEIVTEQVSVQETVEHLLERVKQQQSQRRGKDKVDADLREELRVARLKLKELRVKLRALKEEVYAQVEPKLVELRERRKAGIKAIRQQFAADGLYWGTYNSKLDDHNISVKNVITKRKGGKPAAHRFHRWEREGTLTVQLQRLATDPPRGPELLASGEGKWRNVAQIKPYVSPEDWARMTKAERREVARQGEIVFRVSSTETVTVPVVLQRMMPPEADVTGLQLSRRRKADRQHALTVAVTAKVPATPIRETGPVVAMHVGWRVRDDDSLRVATWVSTEPLEVPEIIQDIVVGHGTWGEIIFPAEWRKEFDFVESLRSRRDKALDQVKNRIAEFLEYNGSFELSDEEIVRRNTVLAIDSLESSNEEPVSRLDNDTLTSPTLTPALVKQWRSAGRVTTLYNLIKGSGHVFESFLKDWVRQDKHLWRFEFGRRTRLLRRRKHRYQNAVAWLARTARLIIIDDIDISDLSRVRSTDDRRIEIARANRVLAAPGDLRRYMENACQTHGAQLRKSGTVVSRLTHYLCGTATATPEEYADQVVVFCSTCHRGFDQDMNMGHLLLSAAGEAPPIVVKKG